MRDKKMGYGEIAIALSLCQKMPGGATDANIQQVMAMRQGTPAMGWGEIAKKLGTKLGPAVSQVRNVHQGGAQGDEARGQRRQGADGETSRRT